MSEAKADRYHHGNLRVAVIRRAALKIESHGFDGISLREIARELGVSHAAPGRHFPDRQALQDGLVLYGHEQLARSLGEAMAAPVGNVEDDLTAFARGYVGFAAEHPALVSLMLASTSDKDTASHELRQANDRTFGGAVEMIDNARERGDIVQEDPDRIAMAVLAAVHGLAAMASGRLIGGRSIDDVVTGTIATLVHGLRPRRAFASPT